jgi:hypothetical protein
MNLLTAVAHAVLPLRSELGMGRELQARARRELLSTANGNVISRVSWGLRTR